jgi:hypothetical protein
MISYSLCGFVKRDLRSAGGDPAKALDKRLPAGRGERMSVAEQI